MMMSATKKYENATSNGQIHANDLKSENVIPNGGSAPRTEPSFRIPDADNAKVRSGSDPRRSTSKGDPLSTPCQSTEQSEVGLHAFVRGIKADIKNKDLIPLKILFFFKYATVFVLYPFMTLHLKSLGLNETEAGWNSALIPVFSILGPPAFGIIADRIGNFKGLLAGITIVNAPLALVLLLVPKARETITLPENLIFGLGCGSRGSDSFLPFTLQSFDPHTCTIQPPEVLGQSNLSEISSILQCGQVCSVDSTNSNLIINELPPLDHIPVSIGPNGVERRLYYRLPDQKRFFIPFAGGQNPQLICEGNKCSIQFLTIQNSSYNPDVTTAIYQTDNFSTGVGRSDNGSPVHVKLSKLRLMQSANGELSANVTNPEFGIEGGFIFGEKKLGSEDHCSGESETIRIRSAEVTEINCTNQCLLQLKRQLFCSNNEELMIYDVALTFWLYTGFRVLLGIASATAFILFEGAVMAIMKECGGDYGLQRVSATLAAVIFAPLSGALIQIFHGFTAAFCLYTALQVICAILTFRIDLRFKPPAERLMGNLKEILVRIDIILFFVAILISGTAWGYLESFLFWFLQDLGASNFLMGLTISVGGLAGIPLLIVSRPIIAKFGHVNILAVGLLFYGVRLVGYSFIQNPWFCLPWEALEALTASLAITAAATYASSLSTQETIASIQAIWGSLYFGIGRASGSLAGGYFIKWFGARRTFQIFALMSFIGSAVYFLLNFFFIDKYTKAKKAEPSNQNNNEGDPPEEEINTMPNNGVLSVGNLGPTLIVPGNIDKFTNIPLDDDDVKEKEGKTKFDKVRPRKKKTKNSFV